MRQNQMIEMRCGNRTGIDNRIAIGLRLLSLRAVDPDRGQAEGGILGGGTRQLASHTTWIDRQQIPGKGFALADLDPLEQNAVSIGFQFQIVANVNRGNEKADFLCKLLAYPANTPQQFAVLGLVDQWNQPIADFQTKHIEGATSAQLASCDSPPASALPSPAPA
jgi:hypothetical protein